jgi:RNA polymerase sigma-70 factor (ECF subfamily)
MLSRSFDRNNCISGLGSYSPAVLIGGRQSLVVLSEIDRELLQHCLARAPRAWEQFVDRFLGLVVHVVNHTGQSRSIRLTTQDAEDLAAEVFLAIVKDDFSVLRRFRGESSLATYLTVISRRIVVRELLKRRTTASLVDTHESATTSADRNASAEEDLGNREEVERLLERLDGPEKDVVRMYHLEGKSYQEISTQVGMPENSVGPTLSRAREKMRRASADTPSL